MIKYVGPKPLISHTGIDFQYNKEDKFVYIPIVIQFIKALSNDYTQNSKCSYNTDTGKLDERDLYEALKIICPDIHNIIKEENEKVEKEMQRNIKRTHENQVLSDLDKEILENNFKIMHNYLVQRAINKRVYYSSVEALAEVIKTKNIDYIVAPMFPKFTHVFHSLQGVLRKKEFSLDSKIDIYKENSTLLVKLQVISR